MTRFLLRQRPAYRGLNNQDAVLKPTQWNRTSWRETCTDCVKSQKHKRDRDLKSPLQHKRRAFNTALKKLVLSSQTMSDKLQFPVLQRRAVLSMTCPTTVKQTTTGVTCFELKHRTASVWLRSGGHLNQVWWAIIISMRYCTGCGEACCCYSKPQALCEFDRPFMFYFSTANLCSLRQWSSSSDDKSLPSKKKKKKISSQQLKELQRQTLTFTISFLYLIIFRPTSVLVTKVSLGFWEVILKCTAHQNKKIIYRLMRKPFRGQFWGKLWRSKTSPTISHIAGVDW